MRALPEDNLAYPVLITIGNSQGTGFFMNTQNESYLVTAKHVLFNSQNGLLDNTVDLVAYPRNINEVAKYRFQANLSLLNRNGDLYFSQNNDVAGFKINSVISIDQTSGARKVRLVDGVSVLEHASSGVMGVSFQNSKLFDEVLESNETFIFGYPSSIGLRHSPQIDYEKPLLKRGIVSGKNSSTKTIILDCAVFPGNSGGPVIELERIGNRNRISIIGVVSQFVPYIRQTRNSNVNQTIPNITNSGYSVIESMDEVFNMFGIQRS